MSRLKRMITLSATVVSAAVGLPALAQAGPSQHPPMCFGVCRLVGHMHAASSGSGSGSGSTKNPDLVEAERAATSMSAPLDRFGLIHVHNIARIPGSEVTRNQGPEAFQFDDAAIGAAAMAGLVLLGTASATTVRRRTHLRQP
jgi:hypothetical protein